jgi:hypothetical protein
MENENMVSKKTAIKPISFEELVNSSKDRCSADLQKIEESLSELNKLEIISRLSILTQTQIGRDTIDDYSISDLPCLHFIIGLSLKSESCSDIEPSNQDIDKILRNLEQYFKNFFLSGIHTPGKKEKDDKVIFHAQMHALIGQINPEKYPFQMKELLHETFGHLDYYLTEKFGFTIIDAIEFSEKIIHQYENSINSKYKIGQNKDISDEKKWNEFYSQSRKLLAIVPEEFCEANNCDITKFQKYLKAFSCSFGDGDPTYNSPLDANLFLKKPILKINDQYFTPIPQDLFQKLPSIFEELLETEKRGRTTIWQKYQKSKAKFTETKVTEYLGRIFKKDRIYENLFYTIEKGKTAEVDHIIPYCGNVLIIESKSGNFSITAKKEGLARITYVLSGLISDAHNQGIRTKEFIKNKIPAIFENSNGKKELELTYEKNKTHFILINVTLEPLLSFSSSLKNIESIGIFSQTEYPWSVNLFELDIITKHIDSPAVFIHYIERRLRAQDENVFSTFDELSFLGFYLDWGNFCIYLEDGTVPTKIHLDTEFLEGFDQYYLHGKDPPELKIEDGIKQIINELEQLHADGFTNLTNVLLDLDHTSRKELLELIEKICTLTKKDGKRHTFSTWTQKNKVGITAFSQKDRENLSEHLSSFCQLKKYQCQADCWIGFGIDILDSSRAIHEYFFYDAKWKRDKNMDQTVKWALKKGVIQSKPNYKL